MLACVFAPCKYHIWHLSVSSVSCGQEGPSELRSDWHAHPRCQQSDQHHLRCWKVVCCWFDSRVFIIRPDSPHVWAPHEPSSCFSRSAGLSRWSMKIKSSWGTCSGNTTLWTFSLLLATNCPTTSPRCRCSKLWPQGVYRPLQVLFSFWWF